MPGWYVDPYRRHELRWHDDTAWTEHVADAGTVSVDPDATPAEPPRWPSPPRPAPHRLPGAMAVAAGVVVVVGAFAGWGLWRAFHPFAALQRRLDALEIPAEFTRRSQSRSGNGLCLDSCPTLDRTYGTALDPLPAYERIRDTLARQGYRVDPAYGTGGVTTVDAQCATAFGASPPTGCNLVVSRPGRGTVRVAVLPPVQTTAGPEPTLLEVSTGTS